MRNTEQPFMKRFYFVFVGLFYDRIFRDSQLFENGFITIKAGSIEGTGFRGCEAYVPVWAPKNPIHHKFYIMHRPII